MTLRLMSVARGGRNAIVLGRVSPASNSFVACMPAPAGATFDQRHNNCSGKHAGFLAYCRMTETPLDTYLDDGHPLQRTMQKHGTYLNNKENLDPYSLM